MESTYLGSESSKDVAEKLEQIKYITHSFKNNLLRRNIAGLSREGLIDD